MTDTAATFACLSALALALALLPSKHPQPAGEALLYVGSVWTAVISIPMLRGGA